MRRARTRGFTLVELLIALAILAIVAVLSWRGLDGMSRAQSQTRAHNDAVLTLQAGLAQWGADLDAMLELREVPPLDWDGRAMRIVRQSAIPGQPGPQVVAWTRRGIAEGGQWLRWQSPPLRSRLELLQAWEQAAQWAQSPGALSAQREVAIVPLTDWRLFYFRGNAWTNPLSSAGTSNDGLPSHINRSQIPDAVRLELELPPGGPISGVLTRDWARPTLGGNKS